MKNHGSIKIVKCSDSSLWYANHIGETFDLIVDPSKDTWFWTREPAGFSNIVYRQDAVLTDPDWSNKLAVKSWYRLNWEKKNAKELRD